MPAGPEPRIGGGTNARPLDETIGETGPGVPDEAVGPEERTLPEEMQAAREAEADPMAAKLAREAAERQPTPPEGDRKRGT